MRKLIIAAVVIGGLAASACNTVDGAGKDIDSAGTAVKKEAKKL